MLIRALRRLRGAPFVTLPKLQECPRKFAKNFRKQRFAPASKRSKRVTRGHTSSSFAALRIAWKLWSIQRPARTPFGSPDLWVLITERQRRSVCPLKEKGRRICPPLLTANAL